MHNRIEELGGRVIYASSPVKSEHHSNSSAIATSPFIRTMLQHLFGACSKYWNTQNITSSGSRGIDQSQQLSQQQQQQPICTRYIYDTCVVVDCTQWSDAMNACTLAQFPDVQIRIQQSDSSLTGFCIVLRLQPLKTGWQGDYDFENDYEILGSNSHGNKHFSVWHSIWHRASRLCIMQCTAGKWTQHVAGMVVLCGILHMAHLATRGFVTFSKSHPQQSANSSQAD